MTTHRTIAIIGAGIAGLTAAYHLREKYTVTLYEKSRGLTGRAATRWHDLPDRQRVYIDHGAQYLRDESSALHELIVNTLPQTDRVEIGRPVWTFDSDGNTVEGDPARYAGTQWAYRRGLSTLGSLIVQAGSLNVRLQTCISKLTYTDHRYQLIDDQGQKIGEADQVLITIPSEQAADLIAASDLAASERDTLEAALRGAVYRRCLSVTLGFDRVIRERPYYALVNLDRTHALVWLAFEHLKAGHVPAGHSVLIAQMAGRYSLEQWETDRAQVTAEAADMVSVLLDEDLRQPAWTEYQKWRYSQPDSIVPESTLNGILTGLWFAGDYTRGGRVHLAAQSGKDVAAQMES